MAARMLSGAFTLIGPYSWHLFKKRISWVKEPSEPKEKTRYPDWQRAGSSVCPAGVFHQHLQDTPLAGPSWLPGCWPCRVLWPCYESLKLFTPRPFIVPLPPDFLNKLQYLKSLSKNSIYYLLNLPAFYDNALFRKIVRMKNLSVWVWALIEFMSL